MSNGPTNQVPVLGALVFSAALVGALFFIGCAIRTSQSFEWFSRDHSRHETNVTTTVKP